MAHQTVVAAPWATVLNGKEGFTGSGRDLTIGLADEVVALQVLIGEMARPGRSGCRRVARRRRARPGRGSPPVESQREQGVGGLGLAVGLPLVVRPAFEVGILEIDRGEPSGRARQGDHPRAFGPGQGGQEPERQLEMAEVVGGELAFIAAAGRGSGVSP